MTPEYIYNNMTWAELGDALEYAYTYETDSRHWAAGAYSGSIKLSNWLERKDGFRGGLKKLVTRAKRK